MAEPYAAEPVGHVVTSRTTISCVRIMDDFPCGRGERQERARIPSTPDQ